MSAPVALVRAHADASYRHRTGAYGVTLQGWRPPHSVDDNGMVPPGLKGSFMAELFALLRAVEVARQTWPGVERLEVYSDCRMAIECVTGARPPDTHARSGIWDAFHRAAEGVEVLVRYARSRHGASGTTPPSHPAARADWLARAALGIAHIETCHRKRGPGAVARGAR